MSTCEKGQDLGKALQLFKHLRRQCFKFGGVTCSALISACEKSKQPEWAQTVLEVIQREGVVPDGATMDSFVRAFEASGQCGRTLALFAETLTPPGLDVGIRSHGIRLMES